MDAGTTEIFRGHLDECLKHLGTRLAILAPRRSRNSAKSRLPMAAFCGIQGKSVLEWFNEKAKPKGAQLFKCMCYLDMIGYRVIELERTKRVKRNIVELIGFGIFSSQQMTELLGYTSSSHFFRAMEGQADKAMEQKMWDLWKERKEELDKKKQEAKPQAIIVPAAAPAVIVETPRARAAKEGTSGDIGAAAGSLVVNFMKGLLVLLESVSDESLLNLTRQESGMILELSARMSTLSSKLIGKAK